MGWIFLRGEYFGGEYFFGGWIFLKGEYLSGVNIFRGESVTCESLYSREFSIFFFWNFTSRSWIIFISLFFRDCQSFLLHFHFLKRVMGKFNPFSQEKREKFDTKFHKKKFTIQGGCRCRTQNKARQE